MLFAELLTMTPLLPCILVEGRSVFVDADLLDELSAYQWLLKDGYACMKRQRRVVSMHRFIMAKELYRAPLGCEVHHKNGDKLDNRRRNLRVVAPGEHELIHSLHGIGMHAVHVESVADGA